MCVCMMQIVDIESSVNVVLVSVAPFRMYAFLKMKSLSIKVTWVALNFSIWKVRDPLSQKRFCY